jgi:uncharacterized protein YraI
MPGSGIATRRRSKTMSLMKKAVAGSIAGAALLMSAGAALAYPAEATGSVNVRSGPSTGYAVLDTLHPGENVDIRRCRGGWCFVSHNGPDGWVSARYLGRGYARAPLPPPIVYHRAAPLPVPLFRPHPRFRHHHRHFYPRHHYRSGFCVGGRHSSFCINP